MKHIILILTHLCLCCSCQNQIKEESTATNDTKTYNISSVPLVLINETPKRKVKIEQPIHFELPFEDFVLRIDTFSVLDEKGIFQNIVKL